MKKVLIISYFAPPCQLTSSNRIGSWLEYLPDNGYHPILVTRKWTGKEMNAEERLYSTTGELEKELGDKRTIYQLTYKQSLRDVFYVKGQQSKIYAWLSKVLTLLQVVLINFTPRVSQFYNLYSFSKELLQKDPTIDLVMVSGNPFEQFFFAYLLKKEFLRIKWIADYRDEWNTSLVYQNARIKIPLLSWLEKRSERKWLGSSTVIQTVCPYFTQGLSTLHNRQIEVVPNGFDSSFEKFLNEDLTPPSKQKLHLVFGGTLFPNQSITLLLEALSSFSEDELCVEFVGSRIALKDLKVRELMEAGVLKHTAWIPKSEMIERMKNCDGFLMFPFKAMKGMPSSKLYDYLPFRKPIFLIPSDEDIIEDILTETQLGIVCNSLESLLETLRECINLKKGGKELIPPADVADIIPYSRKEAVKIQVEIFNKIISQE